MKINETISYIYSITNKITSYTYVGSTSRSIEDRVSEHFRPSTWKKNPNSEFYKDIQTYGREGFEVKKLDECFTRHQYIVEEYWWKKLFKENYSMYEIKMGNAHSLNTKQRIAAARNRQDRIDFYNSEEFKVKTSLKTSGELNGMWGKKGENAINGRMVCAFYDKEHSKVFKQFNSIRTALSYIGIKGHVGLLKACRENKLYHGYYWTKEWIDR